MNNYSIYTITNKINGRIYIGGSKVVEKRWKCHLSDLRSGGHINQSLQADWDVFGEKAFEFTIVESGLSQSDATERENAWLAKYFDKGNKCYNAINKSNSARRPARNFFWKKAG